MYESLVETLTQPLGTVVMMSVGVPEQSLAAKNWTVLFSNHVSSIPLSLIRISLCFHQKKEREREINVRWQFALVFSKKKTFALCRGKKLHTLL